MRVLGSLENAVAHSTLRAALLACALVAGPALAAPGVDAEADRILKSMSTYLAGARSLSVTAEIDLEIITKEAQKLQFSSYANVVVQRPAGLSVKRKGMLAETEAFYDGKTLTLYGAGRNAYGQKALVGTNDTAILAFESETGIPAPAADLLLTDPYKVLISGANNGLYIGNTYVDGIECQHLAFRKDDVDWQIWIQAGDKPLPMKYVITSKWQTGTARKSVFIFRSPSRR